MQILGKTIPISLEKIVASNWKQSICIDSWQTIFPDKVKSPIFYSSIGIERETKAFYDDFYRQVISTGLTLGDNHEHLFEDEIFWFGRKEEGVYPGFVDGRNVLLIGEIGLEMMFGLYYRKDVSHPSIIYFNCDLIWVEIASDIDEFLSKVKVI